MREPRSFIVRIYRRGFRTLSGVIEDTSTNTQQPFRDIDELIAMLREPDSRAAFHARRGKVRSTT